MCRYHISLAAVTLLNFSYPKIYTISQNFIVTYTVSQISEINFYFGQGLIFSNKLIFVL